MLKSGFSESNSINYSMENVEDLPPGFRFHPTDEELITHYLLKKVLDSAFSAAAIGEADMNKVEPWDLPWRAKLGEKEWYFFCIRDRKYPTGQRTNRATATGYWKATGKDKEIFRGKTLVGMKKTLVFYKGRAPKGEKSNWVCHEYRLGGKFSGENLPASAKNDWVISRVFKKTCGGEKVHISGLMKVDSPGSGSGHVHCFSSSVAAPATAGVDNSVYGSYAVVDAFWKGQDGLFEGGMGFRVPGPLLPGQDHGPSVPISNQKLSGPFDVDCIWGY